MRYARITEKEGTRTAARVLPMASVPHWDPENPAPGTAAVPDGTRAGWVSVDGGDWIPPAPRPVSLEELQKKYTGAVQHRLDAFARTRGYDGILSACSYATSAVPQFAGEAAYCVSARDLTWAKCYEILADALAGGREIPTLEGLMAELPVLEWPGGDTE